MVVMRSAGYSRNRILSMVFFLSLITAIVNGACTLVLAPWCEAKSLELIDSAKSDPAMFSLDSGRFLSLMDTVVYIEDMEDSKDSVSNVPDHIKKSKSGDLMKQIYILSQGDANKNIPPSVTIANEGNVHYDSNDLLWLTLNRGIRYEGPNNKKQFRCSYFDEYTALVPEGSKRYEPSKVSAKSTKELMSDKAGAPEKAELEWRIVQPFSVIVLALLVVPLSMVNPRQGRFAKLLPAIMIYLSYYLFAFGLKSSISREHFPLFPGIMLIPVLYTIFMVIPFNLLDTEWCNRLRYRMKKRKAPNV